MRGAKTVKPTSDHVNRGVETVKPTFNRVMRRQFHVRDRHILNGDGTLVDTPSTHELRLIGKLSLDANRIKLPEKTMRECNYEIHVGAWVGRGAFRSSVRKEDDDTFELSIPYSRGDPDTVKLEVYCVIDDEETGLTKPFPLVSTFACIHELARNGSADVEFLDPFENPLSCKASLKLLAPVDTTLLRESCLRSVKQHNDSLLAMAQGVVDTIKAKGFHVPAPAKGFEVGLTYLPSGGSKPLGIPPVSTHYAVLSRYTGNVDRPVPHSLLAYYLQQSLTHSGLTVAQLNALPDAEFAREAGDILWGIAGDAGFCPYEPDRTLSVGMQIGVDGIHLGLAPVTTENISLPFAEGSFIRRDKPVASKNNPTTNARTGLMDPRNPQALLKQHFESLGAKQRKEDFVCFMRSLLIDDCETSAMAGMLATSTVKKGDMTLFASELKSHPLFQHWTDECFRQCSACFARLQGMLANGQINVSLMVGLAGGASADQISKTGASDKTDDIDAAQNLNGHCFAVLRHVDPSTNKLYVRLLEGTTRIKVFSPVPIEYTCTKISDSKPIQLPMDKFQTILCQSISDTLSLTKSVVHATDTPLYKVDGIARDTVALPCLHSLTPTSDIPFYKWCVYTGLSCSTGVGSLLLDDREFGASTVGAGCRPWQMASSRLQALSAELPDDMSALGERILDEAWPPIATKETFHGVMDHWETLTPLAEVNADLAPLKKFDVPYSSIACMESPNDPGCVEYIHQINCLVVNEANRLNLSLPDSDGIFVKVDRIGTGVSKTVHIPHRSSTLTYMRSLRKAQFSLGWPGAPDPDLLQKNTTAKPLGTKAFL